MQISLSFELLVEIALRAREGNAIELDDLDQALAAAHDGDAATTVAAIVHAVSLRVWPTP